MSEAMKVALTVSLTAFATILTFSIGQIIQRLIIEPIQEHRRLIGKIAVTTLLYRNHTYEWLAQVSENEKQKRSDEHIALSRTLLAYAAELSVTPTLVPFYLIWSGFNVVISRRNMQSIGVALVEWSSDQTEINVVKCVNVIYKSLPPFNGKTRSDLFKVKTYPPIPPTITQ